MSTIAVSTMVVTIILVWRGLVASTVLLKILPSIWESQEEEPSSYKE